jgi:APA family basic amino acid/polyamine antiporter
MVGSALSLVEIVGLGIVIAAGARFIGDESLVEFSDGAAGLFTGASLMFFAFLGFEQVANFAQEIKNPGKNVPRAILISGAIAAVLYVLAAIVSVSVLGWEALSASKGPLAEVADRAAGGWASDMLFVIALVATSSTVLIALATVTRAIYGMAASGALPKALAAVGRGRQTPWAATIAVTVAAMLIALAGDIGIVAEMANFMILLVFIGVNLSLIGLRRRQPALERPFRAPLSVAGVPLFAALGIGGCIFLMANVSGKAALYSLIVVALSGSMYLANRRRRAAR